jgi:hypothetical protein
MKTLARTLSIVLAGLAGGLLLVVMAGLPAPSLVSDNGLVSARGPLELDFRQALRPESLSGRLSLLAADGNTLAGRVETLDVISGGARVRFWPDSGLAEGMRYTLHLERGVQSQDGLVLRRARSWEIQVRPMEVIYLSSAQAPDLWAALPDGGLKRSVTATGGRIFDFEVSLDGNQIFYSAYNEQGGIDLWSIGRAGGTPEMLLPCRADWCINPSPAPDGSRLVYSRRQAGALAGQEPGAPHLWLLDLNDLNTSLLLPDPNVAGFQPAWSPDGRYLAFPDALRDHLYVLDWQARTLSAYTASLNGPPSWFNDSRRIFISRIVGGGDDSRPYVQVFALDVDSGELEQVLGVGSHLYDYSLPAWSPAGEWLAVALRRVDSGPGKSLWRMHLDGSQAELLSPGEIFTHGAYHWDMVGQRLVYQRLEFGSSQNRPEVLVWTAGQHEPVLVAEDAVLPRWLP